MNDTSPKRDPRSTPHIGDEIGREFPGSRTVNGYVFRKVTRAHGGFVFYVHDNGHYTKPRIATIQDWQRWAKTAEVIEHVAD